MKPHKPDPLDKLLQERLSDYRADTTPDDWAAILQKMDKADPQRPAPWWKGKSRLALLALLFGFGSGSGLTAWYLTSTHTQATHNSSFSAISSDRVTIATPSQDKTGQSSSDGEPNRSKTGSIGSSTTERAGSYWEERIDNSLALTAPAHKMADKPIERQDDRHQASRLNSGDKRLTDRIFRSAESNRSTSQLFAANHSRRTRRANRIQNTLAQANAYEQDNNMAAACAATAQGQPKDHLASGEFSSYYHLQKADGLIFNFTSRANLDKPAGLRYQHLAMGTTRNPLARSGSFFVEAKAGLSLPYLNLTLNPAQQAGVHEDYLPLRRSQEHAALSPGLQVGGGYRFRNGWEVSAGLQYQALKRQADYNYTLNKIPVYDSATRAILGYVQTNDTTRYHLSYQSTQRLLTLPIGIGYTMKLHGPWSLRMQAGGALALYGTQRETYLQHFRLKLDDKPSLEMGSRIQASVWARAGLVYRMKGPYQLLIMPEYQRYYSKAGSNDIVRGQLQSIGLTAGLQWLL